MPGLWRTLSINEWDYILNQRSTPSGIRYAKANVNGVDGVILLPDSWSTSIYTLNYTNLYEASFATNQISLDTWQTCETNGAVFLPCAKYRGEVIVYNSGGGCYWTTTVFETSTACRLFFTGNSLMFTAFSRYYGLSVRLVQDVQ